MRLTKKQNGYTIVEVLIVLAITGVMLIVTTLLVSDQASRYHFREITYNTQQAIQSAINDVQTGYFGEQVGTGVCSAPKRGQSDCMYVGKKITIQGTPNKIIVTPLYIDDLDEDPSMSSVTVKQAPSTESILSDTFTVSPDPIIFYVMFTNYVNRDAEFVSGAQGVKLYQNDDLSGAMPTGGLKVCLEDGIRETALAIGANGSLAVDREALCP